MDGGGVHERALFHQLIAVFGHAQAPSRVSRALRKVVALPADASVGLVGLDEQGSAWWGSAQAFGAVRPGRGWNAHVAMAGLDVRAREDAPSHFPATGRFGDTPFALGVVGALAGRRRGTSEAVERFLPDDSETARLWAELSASHQKQLLHRLISALWSYTAGYAVLLATPELLIGARDPYGIGELWLGEVEGAHALATHQALFRPAGGKALRSLKPGEVCVVDGMGGSSIFPFQKQTPRPCAQRAWQLAGEADVQEGIDVRKLRQRLAEATCAHLPEGVDLLVPFDDASQSLVSRMAQKTGLAWADVFERDGRVIESEVRGARIALVSLRSTAGVDLSDRIDALYGAGAAEVHVLHATPAITSACAYGVGVDPSVPQASRARSVTWLSASEALDAWHAESSGSTPCFACVGGVWPVCSPSELEQMALFAKPEGGSLS